MIQRLVQKIGCTAMQSPALGFLVNIGGEDDDWQVNLTPLGTQRFENSESIKMWHEQIEQNQVRIELVGKVRTHGGNQSLT